MLVLTSQQADVALPVVAWVLASVVAVDVASSAVAASEAVSHVVAATN